MSTGRWITPRAVARAHKLWLEGVPARTIAAELGGVCTRNAIIAYARRQGWPPRGTPIRPKAAPPVKPPAHGHRSPAARPLAIIAAPHAAVHSCQWPLWGRGKCPRPPRFCDAPTVQGHSWCTDHLARCYIRPRRDGGGHFVLTSLVRVAA